MRRRYTLEIHSIATRAAELAQERKAQNVLILDVRKMSSYTDFVVIASGTSDRHVQSVAEHVARGMTEEGKKPIGTEGLRDGQWALIDLGTVVVHVFHQFQRDVYRLEELWESAPRVPISISAKQA